MSGSRFHPYLSTQDERLAALAASTTYLHTPFLPYSVINQTDVTTPSILNASHFPPQPLAPYQALSTPYTLIGGTGWQPGVGMPASQYWPRDQMQNLPALEQQIPDPNLLAKEQQRLDQNLLAKEQQRLDQNLLAKEQQRLDHNFLTIDQQIFSVQQQQRMEAHNIYMADRSQEYIRYMDQLRLISSLPAVATVPVPPTLPDPVSSPPPIQDHPLNLSLKDRFEDSTRGSSELSSSRSTFASTSSDSMSMEKSTGSKTSPEPSLVKLAPPKKRSYQPNSEKFTGPDTLSPEPSLVRISGPMRSSSSSKKQSQPSSVMLILSKRPSAENPSLKLIGSEKGISEQKLTCSKKPLPYNYKSSSTKVIDFKKTSSEKSKKSACPSSDPSTGLAVKIHPTKAIEVEGLEPEVGSMFPYLEATDMGTIVLWNFLWALLKDSNYRQVLRWIDQPTLKFEVIQPQDLARLWGIVKKNTSMNLDKLMKVIDLYVKKEILKQGDEKFVFQFVLVPQSK